MNYPSKQFCRCTRSLSDLTVRSEGKQKLVSFYGRLRRIVVLFNEIDREKWLIAAFPQ